jgi:hypothetical protein
MRMSRTRQFETVRCRSVAVAIFSLVLGTPTSFYAATATATQSLSASLSPIGKVSVPSSVSLTHTGTTFADFSATMSVSYRVRTTSTGSGSITLQAGSDFSPSGGPLVSSGNLTYTCSSPTLGTACSGTQTVSTSSATSVLTIASSSCTGGGGSCSSSDPNTVSINLGLTNDTGFATGAYSASVTFTISAT